MLLLLFYLTSEAWKVQVTLSKSHQLDLHSQPLDVRDFCKLYSLYNANTKTEMLLVCFSQSHLNIFYSCRSSYSKCAISSATHFVMQSERLRKLIESGKFPNITFSSSTFNNIKLTLRMKSPAPAHYCYYAFLSKALINLHSCTIVHLRGHLHSSAWSLQLNNE